MSYWMPKTKKLDIKMITVNIRKGSLQHKKGSRLPPCSVQGKNRHLSVGSYL